MIIIIIIITITIMYKGKYIQSYIAVWTLLPLRYGISIATTNK